MKTMRQSIQLLLVAKGFNPGMMGTFTASCEKQKTFHYQKTSASQYSRPLPLFSSLK